MSIQNRKVFALNFVVFFLMMGFPNDHILVVLAEVCGAASSKNPIIHSEGSTEPSFF